jgi:hypothetical protein
MQDATVQDEVDLAARQALEDVEDQVLHTKVQINISVSSLRSTGFYCVVGYTRENDDVWQAVGFTETSESTDSVTFVKSMTTDFNFETPQRLRFELIRLTNPGDLYTPHPRELKPEIPTSSEMVDAIECLLVEVVSSPGSRLTLPVESGGSMTMYIEEIKEIQNMVSFNVRVDAVAREMCRRKKLSNLFFTINRSNEYDSPGSRRDSLPIVVKSEPISIDQGWESIRTSVNSLCRGDTKRDIIFQLFGITSRNDDVLVASTVMTYTRLEECFKSGLPLQLELIGTSEPKRVGCVELSLIKIERRDSFLDYISCGLEISLFIAIDFTKSNKDSHVPGSLHYMNPETGDQPNDYIRAITSVVDILQHYDSDKKIPVYGFGARLPPAYSHCSHCFACNGNFFDPEVQGVEGVINAYGKTLNSVVLHGPTNFSQIVNLVSTFAKPYSEPRTGDKPRYFILLVITDGVITDMKSTINEVVKASELPVSIIVVGVGDEDFGLMNLLDSDEALLYSPELKQRAKRDIVQFVPFNDFRDKSIHALAMETLDEIPREVVSYFRSKNVTPASLSASTVSNNSPASFSYQIDNMKSEFVAQCISTTAVDEHVVRQIIECDGIPAQDTQYLVECATKMERGKTPLDIPRPITFDNVQSPTDISQKYRKTVREMVSHQSSSMMLSPTRSMSVLVSNIQTATVGDDKADKMCRVCFDRVADTVMVPCGHSVVCDSCSSTVGGICPLCRKPIQQIVKTYNS